MRSLPSDNAREGQRRDIARRLLARIDADIARLREPGAIAMVEALAVARDRIADHLVERTPSADSRRRAAHR